ncbi:CBS domain-containing protein [Boseongicola aestuarii]|uniref:Inosine 5'-monophosphate dehydrogenase n=1 Tax=Boseongicola aestuarii TaxID=1470561 RepID=A0A238J257_9RHOB|nr:CBS domain-containing protein [Boseongicola aestuarii]SMX24411.1 inosine 5'-monophosphate dehydrogenase [Boseongicola aestuarii]
MLVSQILAMKGGGDVVTIPADTTIQDTARLLSEKKIGAIVVSSGGDIAEGIISERDIVRELGRRGPSCLSEKVSEMMTTELVSATSNETTDQVLQKMSDGRFRHMPVVEGEKMIGLISIGDVVKARLAELAMEKDALEGMIKGF